jgi:hypothetical protein
MDKTHRLIWNDLTRTWVAVAGIVIRHSSQST